MTLPFFAGNSFVHLQQNQQGGQKQKQWLRWWEGKGFCVGCWRHCHPSFRPQWLEGGGHRSRMGWRQGPCSLWTNWGVGQYEFQCSCSPGVAWTALDWRLACEFQLSRSAAGEQQLGVPWPSYSWEQPLSGKIRPTQWWRFAALLGWDEDQLDGQGRGWLWGSR